MHAEESLPDVDLVVGDTVGDYRVDGKLGQGAFGSVFRATHPLIGKKVAIKVLSREFSASADMVSRFVAEAQVVNQIGHKNIIDIFAFGQLPDGRHYYVMDLLNGATLDDYLRARGRLTVAQASPVLRGVARALDAAHRAGVAHRDLKPANVFVADDDGEPFPKLLDFGIAKLMRGGTATSMHKTQTGAPMGTPQYMSPEQCRGRDVDHRTDIYSFGVMTYELLTGQRPFSGQDFLEIINKQVSEEPRPAWELVPDLPRACHDAIAWMMAKDPAARPQSVGAAVDALEAAVGGAPASASWRPAASGANASAGAASAAMAATARPVAATAPTVADGTTPPSMVAAEITATAAPKPAKAKWLAVAAVVVASAIIAIVVVSGGGTTPAQSPGTTTTTPVVPAPVQAPAEPPPSKPVVTRPVETPPSTPSQSQSPSPSPSLSLSPSLPAKPPPKLPTQPTHPKTVATATSSGSAAAPPPPVNSGSATGSGSAQAPGGKLPEF